MLAHPNCQTQTLASAGLAAFSPSTRHKPSCPAASPSWTPPACSVNHISKVCSSIDASVAFYRDILGFIVIKRPQSFEESFEGCW